jgi:phosphoadenosine phosphosulfate reductase
VLPVAAMVDPAATTLSDADFVELNRRFEAAAPQDILRWAAETFPVDLVMTSSFQHEGVALAHMLQDVRRDIPIVFINTRFHFRETLEYRDNVVKMLGLNLQVIESTISFEDFKARYTDRLYDRDPDLCCRINKVEPLRRALAGAKAWINARRRDQTEERAGMQYVERFGEIVKINPLARWSSKDTFEYMATHKLPLHPLFEKGYTSIGCEPCTSLPLEGDERSGRWAGKTKRECGIHTAIDPKTAGENI